MSEDIAVKQGTVREHLRRATHDAHVRLNRQALLAGITRPSFTLDAYSIVLAVYWHFYTQAEEAIDVYLAQHHEPFSYVLRRKLPWLVSDLEYLGIDPARTAPFGEECVLRPLQGRGELIGLLYTIEGSTLGGQVISRHLHEHLGLTAARGARFFNGYQQGTAQCWDEFLQFAETIGGDGDESRSAAEYACHTFNQLEALLGRHVRHYP